jgi:Zn-dependent metalloprotease
MKFHLHRLRWLLIVVGFIGFALVVGGTLARTEDTGSHGAFARLQDRAAGRLDVHWSAQGDIPDFVTGLAAEDRIPYTPSAAERGNPAAIARGFLDENRALFKLTSAADDFQTLRVESDAQLGYAHVRLSQMYQGIPVFGKQLIVHIDAHEKIVAVNGQFTPDIAVPTSATVSKDDAERLALKDLMEQQLEPSERDTVSTEILHDKTQLIVYVAANGQATLAWNVIVMTDGPLGQWSYFVNAGRPAIVHRFDSAEHTKQRRTFSADNKTTIPGRILVEEGERSDDPIAQAAHDNAGVTYDYYVNTFKRDGIDAKGGAIVSTVHYGSDPQDAQNAAWIGQRQQMIYGDGGKVFKPLAYGLDVVGHELTHGVTDNSSQLIYQGQSGALNESYSDFFGVMIAGSDWTVGGTVIKDPPYPAPYLRSMSDPSVGGRYDPSDPLHSVGQPSNMSQYANLPATRKTDNGGVHVNSGIPNKVGFLIGSALGRDKAQQIYYRTLTQYLTPDSDFLAAARATMRAAQDLYGAAEANAVRDAFGQVGLSVNAPTNTPTPSGTRRAATPTPQRTPTQQPSQSNVPGCTNLIINGGFENVNSGWVEVTNGQTTIIDTELPHAGTRSAWLGGSDLESLQYIYQDVIVPANANSVKLNYWRLVHEEKTDQAATDAKFWTVIAKNNGDVLATVEQIVSLQGDDVWKQATFDISQFAGQSVRLAYIAENSTGNISSYFVDDVELLACSSGPVSQPTASGDSVALQGTIRDSATSRGIDGAKIFVMKLGLSATDAAADDTITDDEVLTQGVADASGFYQTDAPVQRGKTYSAIVIAGGYRAIIADDGIKVPTNAKDPYTINATMRPSQ